MAHKFNDDEKEVKEFNDNYFGFGVHRVQLLQAEGGTTDAGKEYIELTFCDPDDGEKTDTARVWFVGKASNISFNTLRQIAVHNAPEDKKETASQAVDRVADSDELVAILNDNVMGGELWFSKYYDPERTYQNQAGETKRSVNKNIYGYEPKLREDLMPQEDALAKRFNEAPAGGVPVTAEDKANIPKNW